MCDKHGVRMEHGLDYEYIVSTSNVLLFGINIKYIQKNRIRVHVVHIVHIYLYHNHVVCY